MDKLIIIPLSPESLTGEVLTKYTSDGWHVHCVTCTSAGAGAAYGFNSGSSDNYPTTQTHQGLEIKIFGWAIVTLRKDDSTHKN